MCTVLIGFLQLVLSNAYNAHFVTDAEGKQVSHRLKYTITIDLISCIAQQSASWYSDKVSILEGVQ